jgi:hypothetical protein
MRRKPLYTIGDFVDVNHRGNTMLILSVKKANDTFEYGLSRINDGAFFDATEEYLKPADKEIVIEGLLHRIERQQKQLLELYKELEKVNRENDSEE